MIDAGTRSLTDEQRRIVETGIEGPYVIDAGAGTGKTFTLVQRARYLVERGLLRPSQLLFVTFMNKAANEIGERLTVAFSSEWISELPTVATFHGLAASLVREFAYEAGVSPDLHSIDDPRARAIFNRAYQDLLHGRLNVDLSSFPLLERDEVLPSSLVRMALQLKNRSIPVDEFEADALAAAKRLETLPFGQIYDLGQKGRHINKDPSAERSPKEREDEGRCEARNVAVVAALFRRFDYYLERESLMTYGDILSRATAMLRDCPSIAQRLRDRWRHAMVDEFQDTNPQQLAFLRAIFGEELTHVMAVGDVRQAIFEWNGADPRGIQVIAGRPGTTTFPLSLNRRSPQQVLDVAHHVLPANADYRGEALRAHQGTASTITIRHAAFGNGADTKENREAEASAIAAEIARLLDSGVEPSEIVILLRARTHARVYSDALAERGIFSKTHGGVGFFDAPEIRDAVAWLRLLDDPTDAFALTRILESPVIGVSHGTIAKLYGTAKVQAEPVLSGTLPDWLSAAERERFERLRAILRKLDPMLSVAAPDAVRAVISETGLDLAHGLRTPPKARQIRANVSKLVALAVGFTHDRPLARLSDLLDEFDERDALEIDEPEAELSGDEVSIMTVHAAKGLEWDHVFVANVTPNVFPSTASGAEVVAAYDEASRALAMRYDVNGHEPLRWVLLTPHNPETGQRLPEPEKDEERRLLYVALTRAKRQIWISGALKRRTTSDYLAQIQAFCDSRGDAAVFGGEGAGTPERSTANAEPDEDAVRRIVERLTRTPTLFDVPAQKLSYTAIAAYDLCPRQARYRYVFRIPDLRDDAIPVGEFADDDGDRQAKLDPVMFGNIVHRALELIAQGRIEGAPAEIDEVVKTALDEHERGSDDALLARTTAAVTHAAKALEPLEPIAAEAEFNSTIAGVHVGGFIDLIARDADGMITIVDYKTGGVPDEYYALQLALYRAAVSATYPETKGVILRVSEDAAEIRAPDLPGIETMEQHVVAASTMREDVARTGIHCRSCPYAGGLCPEGARAVEARATNSSKISLR